MVSASAVNGTHSPLRDFTSSPAALAPTQQSDEVDVLVRTGAHIGDVWRRDRRVMDRAQDRIADVGFVVEKMFWQIDVQGQAPRNTRVPQCIERRVQAITVARGIPVLRWATRSAP